jgi:hypothetical protein
MDATRRNGLGTMSRERWETLIAQFKDRAIACGKHLGDISQTIPPEECFRLLQKATDRASVNPSLSLTEIGLHRNQFCGADQETLRHAFSAWITGH